MPSPGTRVQALSILSTCIESHGASTLMGNTHTQYNHVRRAPRRMRGETHGEYLMDLAMRISSPQTSESDLRSGH